MKVKHHVTRNKSHTYGNKVTKGLTVTGSGKTQRDTVQSKPRVEPSRRGLECGGMNTTSGWMGAVWAVVDCVLIKECGGEGGLQHYSLPRLGDARRSERGRTCSGCTRCRVSQRHWRTLDTHACNDHDTEPAGKKCVITHGAECQQSRVNLSI